MIIIKMIPQKIKNIMTRNNKSRTKYYCKSPPYINHNWQVQEWHFTTLWIRISIYAGLSKIIFHPSSLRFDALLSSLLPFVEEPGNARAPAAAIPNYFFRWVILWQKYYGRNSVILGRNERRRWIGVGGGCFTLHRWRFFLFPVPACLYSEILFRRISREWFRM